MGIIHNAVVEVQCKFDSKEKPKKFKYEVGEESVCHLLFCFHLQNKAEVMGTANGEEIELKKYKALVIKCYPRNGANTPDTNVDVC